MEGTITNVNRSFLVKFKLQIEGRSNYQATPQSQLPRSSRDINMAGMIIKQSQSQLPRKFQVADKGRYDYQASLNRSFLKTFEIYIWKV
jgi:hypothetical protein